MPKGRCRICGCTENNACMSADHGSCWWMSKEEDLCSHCVNFLNDPSIERPTPSRLSKADLANAADNATKMVLRPQFNHHQKGWMISMHTGKGWSNRFSSKVFESKDLAYAYAREFAINSSWYITVD